MMSQKVYLRIIGLIFCLIAGIHLLRIAFGWSAALNGHSVPMWWSWLTAVMSAFLGYQGLWLSAKS